MRRALLAPALIASLALPGVVLWACGGQLPGPKVCGAPSQCGKGYTCVLGRCRVNKTMPVSARAPRLTFEPVDLALLTDGTATPQQELPATIVLGKHDEVTTLMMRFAVKLPEDARVQRALLLLEPMPECLRRPGRVDLELAHVLSPWSSSELARGKRPELSLPMTTAGTTATPARPLRIDVTELVRAWEQNRKRYHGLALLARGEGDTGACFTSGISWGRGPHLDIYLWPREKDAGTDAASDAGDAGDAGDAEAGDAGADADNDGGER
jgi:hypothetical protein